MKNIHFIAIGGAIMHQLAIALQQQGYMVTGSDDEINDPAKSNLAARGLLPEKFGWFPEKITHEVDAIVLGMHAKADNPERGADIFSFMIFKICMRASLAWAKAVFKSSREIPPIFKSS